MRRSLASLVVLAAALGCEAASPGSGLDALLRVADAQWAPDPMPTEMDGPAVTTVRNARTMVWPGQRDKPVSGTLARDATAIALALEGDRGYWILPAGAPDVQAPTEVTFTARLSFAPTLPLGAHDLVLRAVSAAGRFGPPRREPLVAAPLVSVTGALVVSLRWDTNADLDLHVTDPQGIEVWARNINSYQPPPPGQPEDPQAWRHGGILDFDSNAGCVIDGRRQEDVVWADAAPAGQYVVRVDAPSLCGQPAARFVVEVYRQGQLAGTAEGTVVEAQTRGEHGRGAGLYVMAVDYP
jgi:hypothetical protein